MEAFAVGDVQGACRTAYAIFIHVRVGTSTAGQAAGLGVVAEVIPSGIRRKVGIPLVHQRAGGRNAAIEQLRHAIQAASTGTADAHDGINVLIVLQFIRLDVVRRVQKNNDRLEIFFDHLEQFALAVCQHQVMLIGIPLIVSIQRHMRISITFAQHVDARFFGSHALGIAALSAGTGEHHNRRIVVNLERIHNLRIERRILLTDVAVAAADRAVVARHSIVRLIVTAQRRIHVEACIRQCTRQGNIHVFGCAIAFQALFSHTKHANPRIAGQRQCLVFVFQQRRALGSNLRCQGFSRFLGFCHAVVVRGVHGRVRSSFRKRGEGGRHC